MTEQTASLLLEIGTEEVPARFLPKALTDIREIAARVLQEYRIRHETISSFATPRRIALVVTGVAQKQEDSMKEIFGPAKKAAFDEQDRPTKAAEGFARSVGLAVGDLKIRTKGKGEYLAALIEEKGVETAAVLPEALAKIIHSLHFPKAMRWGDGSMQFVRPIQWILAVLDSERIPFEIDGLKSGTISRGHRFLAPASFQIKEIAAYANLLEKNFVLVDQEKRKQAIRKGILAAITRQEEHPILDEELLDTVTYLVEYPVAVRCSFGSEYLRLPKELLITVMKDHQKYFAVQDGNGDLVNSFIVVSNTREDNAETVRAGAERVIKARFDDARFYFTEDRKQSLADRAAGLVHVTFHDRLGSLAEKTARVTKNAALFAGLIAPAVSEKAARAAALSKADLISGVVREFPELQGIMGRYYALHDREDDGVAFAIEEQYLPKNYGDRVPSSDAGAVVSVADRIDNIASFFSIGLIPTGSEDPFALRRQAMGIVAILIEKGYRVSLDSLFSHAVAAVDAKDPEALMAQIREFMEARIEFILTTKGYSLDLIRSMLRESCAVPLMEIIGRMDALSGFRNEAAFPEFLTALKRVNNITPEAELPEVNPDLFLQDEERDLYSTFGSVRSDVSTGIGSGDYPAALASLARLTPAINRFFDKVLVMDKDERVKQNRLSLLQSIWNTALKIADLSKLQ